MTDISKEEVAIDTGWLYGVADNDPKSPALIIAKRYAALQARVEELEAQNKTPKADYVRGRVQGIRDAVEVIDNAKVQEAYGEGCRIHFDDLQDFFANRVDALSEALKGDTND